MRVIVRNTRTVSVAVGPHTFKPRSATPLDADADFIAKVGRRYGLAIESDGAPAPAPEPVAAPEPQPEPISEAEPESAAQEFPCPECGQVCASPLGLSSHRRAKHTAQESES